MTTSEQDNYAARLITRLTVEGAGMKGVHPCPTCDLGVYLDPNIEPDVREAVEDSTLSGVRITFPARSRRAPHEHTCSDCGVLHALEDAARAGEVPAA